MKIIEWLKNLVTKKNKQEYIIEEKSEQNEENVEGVVPKIEVEAIKSREEIFRSLQDAMISEVVSEEYTQTKFTAEKIKEEYDKDAILSNEDITALSCIYSGIKDGNLEEENLEDNKINKFLKENPNNITTLVNLMIKDAKSMHDTLDPEMASKTSIQWLIVGSYSSISKIIDKYNREKDLTIEEK